MVSSNKEGQYVVAPPSHGLKVALAAGKRGMWVERQHLYALRPNETTTLNSC